MTVPIAALEQATVFGYRQALWFDGERWCARWYLRRTWTAGRAFRTRQRAIRWLAREWLRHAPTLETPYATRAEMLCGLPEVTDDEADI